MSTITTADGLRLAYTETGTGPPIVLVHGITESQGVWDPLVDDLATDHRVVTLDLRGHGASGSSSDYDLMRMVDDVAAVVGELGVVSPILVGHSMGGTAVTAYAGQHPTRGVVNIDQAISLVDFQELVQMAEPLLRGDDFADVMAGLFENMQGPLSGEEVARVAALRRLDAAVVLGLWAPMFELTPVELQAQVEVIAAGVTVPYLALHGSDPGASYGPWLAQAIPTSTLEVWDDCGHYPHLVHPERFLERLRAFEADLP